MSGDEFKKGRAKLVCLNSNRVNPISLFYTLSIPGCFTFRMLQYEYQKRYRRSKRFYFGRKRPGS